MKQDINVEIDRHEGKKYIKIGKDYYMAEKGTSQRKEKGHISKVIFKKVDPEEIENRIHNMALELVKSVDKEKIITSVLRQMTLTELEKIEKRLNKKVKVREVRGCYGLKIGDMDLPIVE